jgi:hypothetical protein
MRYSKLASRQPRKIIVILEKSGINLDYLADNHRPGLEKTMPIVLFASYA